MGEAEVPPQPVNLEQLEADHPITVASIEEVDLDEQARLVLHCLPTRRVRGKGNQSGGGGFKFLYKGGWALLGRASPPPRAIPPRLGWLKPSGTGLGMTGPTG